MKTRLALIAGLVCVVAVVLVVLRASPDALTVSVDDEGFFVSTEPAASKSVYPGDGVTLAVVDPNTGVVAGRLAPRATAPSVWVRGADGKLAARALSTATTSEHRADAVRGTVIEWLPVLGDSATASAFAESCGRPASTTAAARLDVNVPAEIDGGEHVGTDDAGLPLESFAPTDCLFVRFRSVEAAYRFASVADELASALLAAYAEDARDYGSLRLALHDLVLPTIWRTNPEAQRGVGEVGLVVAPPFARGRLDVAVLLRITDAELHRMQTVAGLTQQAAPDHLWRPADDPFPAQRDPINFRGNPNVAPRIEVVATSKALGQRIVEHGYSTRSYRDVRHALTDGDVPSPNEAAYFHSFLAAEPWGSFPGILRTTAREEREGLGLQWLAAKWLGAAERPVTFDARSHGPSILASIESVRVVTDEEGAAIDAIFVDAASARMAAAALSSLRGGSAAAGRACAHNLADLVPLALVEKPDEIAERSFVVLGWKPVCPCGGTYSVHPVTREVSCSAHGRLGALRDAPFTPPAVSDVAAFKTSLTFRLAIDWNRRE